MEQQRLAHGQTEVQFMTCAEHKLPATKCMNANRTGTAILPLGMMSSLAPIVSEFTWLFMVACVIATATSTPNIRSDSTANCQIGHVSRNENKYAELLLVLISVSGNGLIGTLTL